MAYKQHWLVQFGGTVGAAQQEIWTCGIRIMGQNFGAPPIDFDPGDGYLVDTAAPAVESWFTDGRSSISPYCYLTYIKCNEIGPDGQYADQTQTNVFNYPAGITGQGSSGSGLPFNCAVVLTWRTDAAARGPGSRGRIYSPHPAVVIDQATGLFSTSVATAMAESAGGLLNSLDDSVGVGQVRPCIASKIGAGTLNQIDAVEVDTVVDTMRKRSNALVGVRIHNDVSY